MSTSYAPAHRPEQSRLAPGDPVRYPSGAPSPVLTKRAFVLILMTLLVPGSAQIVAGQPKAGTGRAARDLHGLGPGPAGCAAAGSSPAPR